MIDYSISPYMTLKEALEHVAFISEAAPGGKFKVLVGPNLEPPVETQAIRGWLFAVPQIMNAGAAGDLHLKGYRPGSATLEDVPSGAFVDASLDPTTGRLEPIKPFPDSVTWSRLRFKREEVYELWPKIDGSLIESPANDRGTTPLLAQELTESYMARVDDSRKKCGHRPTISEDETWRKTQGITRDRMRSLRKETGTSKEVKGGAPTRP